MSDPLIDELYNRLSILCERDDSCISHGIGGKDALTFNLGPKTRVIYTPKVYMRVTHFAAAYIWKHGDVKLFDRVGVEEVVKMLQRLTILDELADV